MKSTGDDEDVSGEDDDHNSTIDDETMSEVSSASGPSSKMRQDKSSLSFLGSFPWVHLESDMICVLTSAGFPKDCHRVRGQAKPWLKMRRAV